MAWKQTVRIVLALALTAVLVLQARGMEDPTATPDPTPTPSVHPEYSISGTTWAAYQTTPMPGVEIILLPGEISTTSDSEGRYVFSGLAPGNYRVEVEDDPPPGWYWAVEGYDVAISWSNVDGIDFWTEPIVFTPTPTRTPSPFPDIGISGTVSSHYQGDPMAGVDLELEPLGWTATTDMYGWYIFFGLGPGEYTVRITSSPPPGWRWHPSTYTVVITNSHVTGVDFWAEEIVFTPSPTPTATRVPDIDPAGELGIRLLMPDQELGPGDLFGLVATIVNPMEERLADMPVFILLELENAFYFWPSWEVPAADLEADRHYRVMDIYPGNREMVIIPECYWPDLGLTQDWVFRFHAAMLTPDFSAVLGVPATLEWTAGPGG